MKIGECNHCERQKVPINTVTKGHISIDQEWEGELCDRCFDRFVTEDPGSPPDNPNWKENDLEIDEQLGFRENAVRELEDFV